ncbi:MAG: molybdopterin molybdenumtransferase MoeA, partial [Pedobacter sp.]
MALYIPFTASFKSLSVLMASATGTEVGGFSSKNCFLHAVNPITIIEVVTLLEAYDRTLAQDCVAEINVPPAANSAMDGYAVNSRDISPGKKLRVSQRIAAGDVAQPLEIGTAARIFTGAEIPENADAVVIQEDCTMDGDAVVFNITANPNDNIRPKGQDIAKGKLLLSRGHRLRAQDIALLSSVNINTVYVYKKLRVAFFSTGNELVEPGTILQPGKIYNSNRYLLAGLLRKLNCELLDLGIVKDSLKDTIEALTSATEADFIISSGGVSAGDEDHVKAAVKSLGKLDLWKLNLKPGKPLAFGSVKNVPFVGLPGNPVSAFVTFELLIKPLIYKLQGHNQ